MERSCPEYVPAQVHQAIAFVSPRCPKNVPRVATWKRFTKKNRWIFRHTVHDGISPCHRCVAQTKAPRFSIPYVSAAQRTPSSHASLAVRLLQTRVADQQLERELRGDVRGMRCQPCALHVYAYTTEKGHHTETAEDAREGRDGTFPNRDLVFWKAVRKEHVG